MQNLTQSHNPFLFEELENRILLSAGAEGLLAYDIVDDPLIINSGEPSIELLTTNQIQHISQKTIAQAQEIIFIDSSVENYLQIIDDLKKGDNGKYLEIVILDEQADGIQQIGETLAFYQEIDAIQFITHGTAGTVQLGATTLNSESLNLYADEIESWGQSLSSNADLLFYGCEIAQNEQGKMFISQLSELTGADVAASSDLTGEQAKGGDWELEYKKGSIEAENLLTPSVQQYFSGTLALNVAPATTALDENSSNGTAVTTVTATGGDQYFQEIYWVDSGQNKIIKANINGSGQTVVYTGTGGLYGFTIDHDAGKMYWSEGIGASSIMRANLDGTTVETIVTGLSNVGSLVLDTANSKIYWSDIGSTEISRANMVTGATEEVLFTSADLTTPQGIDFDYTTGLMYINDSGANNIYTFDVNNPAAGLTSIGTPGSYYLGDITVDPGVALYGADMPGNYVHRFNLDGTNETNLTVFANNNGNLTIDVGNNTYNTVFSTGPSNTTIESYNLTTGNFINSITVTFPLTVENPQELDYANPTAITYSITAGNTNNAFTIDALTGAITVNDGTQLDYETTTSYSLTITATQNADSTTGVITVNINDLPENAPTSSNNTITINEDSIYTFVAADFNFADADVGDTLASVKITSLESAGSLELNNIAVTTNQVITVADINAGKLKFVPVANANGVAYDSFTFTVNDGGLNSVSSYTMTLNVNSVNDAPSGANTTVTGTEDSDYIFIAANFGFTDALDSNSLYEVKITTLTSTGTLMYNSVAVTAGDTILATDIALGKLIFTPSNNNNGINYDSFTFQVRDNGGTTNSGVDLDASPNTMTIDITAVNDAPTAINNTVSGIENTDYIFSASDFNFSDVDTGDTLASVKITSLETSGSLELNGVAVNLNDVITTADINGNKLKFVPAINANGTGYDSFGFSVNDGLTDSITYTITIDIAPVNNVPTASDQTIVTNEDLTYTFVAADFNYNDIDGDTFNSVTITSLEANGNLELNGVAVNLNDVVTVADINAGKLKFVPTSNTSGSGYDSFGFSVNDGVVNSITYTMTIDVNAVNDTPTAIDNTILMNEDATYTFVAADFNYNDIDGDAFSSVKITNLETAGSLELNGITINLKDVITVADISAGNLKFVPASNANGSGYDSFGFTVNDGTTDSIAYTMTVDVAAINDAPIAADKTTLTNEDLAYTFVAADFNYNDIDGDAFNSVKITNLESAGSLELNGVAVNLNDVILVTDINAGNLKFVPTNNASGSGYDNFGFTVNDGVADSISYTMTIDVAAINDAPYAANNTIITDENLTYSFVAADFNYNDTDGDAFTNVIITNLGNSGSLEFNGTAVNLNDVISITDINAGKLKFVPTADTSGLGYDSFSFAVSDNSLNSLSTYTMTIDVNAADITPALTPKTSFFITPNEEIQITQPIIEISIERNTQLQVTEETTQLDDQDGKAGKNNKTSQLGKISITDATESTSSITSESLSSTSKSNSTSTGFINSLSFDLFQATVNGYSAYSESDISQVEFSKVGYSNFNSYSDAGELKEFLISLLQSSSNSIESKILDGLSAWDATTDFKISDSFTSALDLLRMELIDNSTDTDQSLLVGTVKSSGVVLAASVGTWVLRGSTVLASVISSLPMWNSFDPLPILSDANAATNNESHDDIDDLFERTKKE